MPRDDRASMFMFGTASAPRNKQARRTFDARVEHHEDVHREKEVDDHVERSGTGRRRDAEADAVWQDVEKVQQYAHLHTVVELAKGGIRVQQAEPALPQLCVGLVAVPTSHDLLTRCDTAMVCTIHTSHGISYF